MRFAIKLAAALATLPEDTATVDWSRPPSGVAGGGSLLKHTIADPHKDDDSVGIGKTDSWAPRRRGPPPTSAAGLAHDLIRVLNPFDKFTTGGTPDFIAPEQSYTAKSFDPDMVEYFYTVMAIHEPQIARLWKPAVAKYKRFEQECERLLSEAKPLPRNMLSKRLDRLSFTKIIDGVQRIQKVLEQTTDIAGLQRIRAAFVDFARYVRQVTPVIKSYLDERGPAAPVAQHA